MVYYTYFFSIKEGYFILHVKLKHVHMLWLIIQSRKSVHRREYQLQEQDPKVVKNGWSSVH